MEFAPTLRGTVSDDDLQAAEERFKEGYELHLHGQFEQAVIAYQESLAIVKTAEAYTYLGWCLSFKKQYKRAIELCKRAVQIDREYGAAYNDIGAYLIKLHKPCSAIPWLRRALRSRRFSTRHHAWVNLGQAYRIIGQKGRAANCFAAALKIRENYKPALLGLKSLYCDIN